MKSLDKFLVVFGKVWKSLGKFFKFGSLVPSLALDHRTYNITSEYNKKLKVWKSLNIFFYISRLKSLEKLKKFEIFWKRAISSKFKNCRAAAVDFRPKYLNSSRFLNKMTWSRFQNKIPLGLALEIMLVYQIWHRHIF